jgi:hypothetical protein
MVALCGVWYHCKLHKVLLHSDTKTCFAHRLCLLTLQLGREGFSSSHGKFQAAPKADVMSAAFLPSQWLVTGSPTGELLLWDARAAQPTFGCCCQVRCHDGHSEMHVAAGISLQEACCTAHVLPAPANPWDCGICKLQRL